MRNPFKIITWSFLTLFVITLSCSTQKAIAAPSITTVNGSFTNGNTVNIVGSGFGTKTPAAPLLWDNFEGGTAGQLLSTGNIWATQAECTSTYNGGTPSMIYSNDMRYGQGTKSAKQVLVANLPCWARTKLGLIGNQTRIFFSYKYWVATGGSGTHTKMGRVGCNNDVHCTPNMGYTANTPDYWYAFADRGSEKALAYVSVNQGRWERDDTWSVLSSNDASDGTVQIWRNGVQQYSNTALNTKNSTSASSYYNQIFLPYYNESGTRTVYVDDVYADNTIARVEICPGSTWATRGNCEIQIPTDWASDGTSITVTANQGAFASGATNVYLYVVNSSGVANSNGKQISISGTALVSPPLSSPTYTNP